MSKLHSSIIVVGSLFAISFCIVFKIALYYGFFISVLLSVSIFALNGFSIRSLVQMIVKGISECSSVFIIIQLIGVIIAVWMASGVVPTLIYYGFNYIGDINFLLACFLITAAISMVMGTALGTLSTIGMVLLVIGKGVEIPLPIILGAITSGAFMADKMSPLGSMINLTLKTINVQYKDLASQMLVTLFPTVFITSVIYYLIGLNYKSEIDLVKVVSYQKTIANTFFISPLFLLIPVLIMIMAVIGIKVVPNMTMGLLSALTIGFVFQHLSIMEIINVVIYGYKGNTGMTELDSILRGGGILPMLEVIFIIAGAIALNSIFEGTHFIAPTVNRISSSISSKGSLIAKTGLLSMFFTATCDQTVGVLIPGKFLQKKFEELQVSRVILARTVADTGTSIAPLIPWNVNTIFITTITGISVFEYGPYVFLSILSPIVTILCGYIGSTTSSEKNVYEEGLS